MIQYSLWLSDAIWWHRCGPGHYGNQSRGCLTHWGRVTHICVSNLTIIGSDNGLSPGRRQAIIWTNAGILLIGPLGTNFSEMLIEIHTFSFKKIHLKMSSGKWRPFCLGLNVLMGGGPQWPTYVPVLAAWPSQSNPRGSGPEVLKCEWGHRTSESGVWEVGVFRALWPNVVAWCLMAHFLCKMAAILLWPQCVSKNLIWWWYEVHGPASF